MAETDIRPFVYVETSVWNAAVEPVGRDLLRALGEKFQIAYGFEVVYEIKETKDAAKREAILDAIVDSRAMHIQVEGSGQEHRAVATLLDPRSIGPRPPNPAMALERMLQKFMGGQRQVDFPTVFADVKQEVISAVNAVSPTLVPGVSSLAIQLDEMSDRLTREHGPGIEFNSRSNLQKALGINPCHIAPSVVRPPMVIDQLWRILQPALERHAPGMVTIDWLLGRSGAQPTASIHDQCVSMYTMLNSIGFATDHGLTKDHRILSSVRDAQHVACATFCDALITRDVRLQRKAFAIYEYLGRCVAFLAVTEGSKWSLQERW